MADVEGQPQRYTEDWKTLPWKQFERNVFRAHRAPEKRIYRAARRGDFKCVHNLQRLLLRSYAARCLAVRQVSQANRGKRTPGVDGVANLTPTARLALVGRLRHLSQEASPIRRVYIPKPNSEERRPLGIPTMSDRAKQALVKLALEPEWEAQFEANSYGFRPGRSTHDAIEAIFHTICLQPKYVLDADIEKCFDRISHDVLLNKLATIPIMTHLIRAWLKAGVLEEGTLLPTETGTPQGGVISPLLMNVALHGLETDLVNSMPGPYKPTIVRYADDFVILHKDLAVVQSLRQCTDAWLVQLGLNLKPSKTRISHTLHEHDGNLGFDFLGFTVRQYPVGQYRTGTYRGKAGFKTLIKPSKTGQKRHMAALAQVIHEHRSSSQTTLIAALNRKMKGWAMYYRTCVAKHTFCCLDYQLYRKLYRWAKRRHSHQSTQWRQERYWPRRQGRREFNDGRMTLMRYADIRIKRHVKVRGDKSPFDGDWTYWVPRLGRDPSKSEWVVKLLHRQQGRCKHCGLYFMTSDVMEIHHANGNRNNNLLNNLELVHGHCHDEVHGSQYL